MTIVTSTRWCRIARNAAITLAVAVASFSAYAGWTYLQWRNRWIEWDRESIQQVFGGESEEGKIEFIRKWEYRALKPMGDGKAVWLHVKLSKRLCGNWMLMDANQRNLVRPQELRYPNGLPPRPGAVDCLGMPITRRTKIATGNVTGVRCAAQRPLRPFAVIAGPPAQRLAVVDFDVPTMRGKK